MLADVADADAVRAAVAGHDAVIHLAAKVNVVGPEDEYVRINVRRNPRRSSMPAGLPGWNAWCMSPLPRLPIEASRS